MTFSNESRHSRGYGTEWEKIRRLVIERDKGLCQACLAKGRVAMGRDVDHVVPKDKAKKLGWSDAQVNALSNLQYLCEPCHKAKTVKENGGVYRPRPEIGVDGCPKDWK